MIEDRGAADEPAVGRAERDAASAAVGVLLAAIRSQITSGEVASAAAVTAANDTRDHVEALVADRLTERPAVHVFDGGLWDTRTVPLLDALALQIAGEGCGVFPLPFVLSDWGAVELDALEARDVAG